MAGGLGVCGSRPSSKEKESMKRGTICWVNLEDSSPPEFGKVRPGLIVSNSEQNEHLPTVVILPLSTQPPNIWPLRLEIPLPTGKKSFVVVPGIRQVAKSRLEGSLGLAASTIMERISEAIRLYLDD